MKYIIKQCLTCQQSFKAECRFIKRGHAKFCSRKCSSNRYRNPKPPNVKCAYCNKPFYKNNSKQQNSKSKLFFCCREHKDLAQKIGGISEIMPPHYGTGNGEHQYRELAFKHLPHKCNCCPYNIKEVLIVHHKDSDRTNNNISNLEILCRNCHHERHLIETIVMNSITK